MNAIMRRVSLSRNKSSSSSIGPPPHPGAVAGSGSSRSIPPATTKTTTSASEIKTIQKEGPILLGGISLKYILSLVEKEFQTEWTMNEVCEWVMRITATEKLSLLERLAFSPDTSHHIKEKADVFVSYVWSYNFVDLMAALTDDLAPDEDVFVWLDGFCVNQHVRDDVGRDQWMRTFEQALVKIGKAWIVPMPWRDPKNVKRSWCAFELLAVAKNSVPNKIKMSKKERGDLKQAMLGNNINLAFLQSFFSDVDIRKAEAFKPEDRATISSLIAEYEKKEGTGKVNHIVLESLKRWLLEVADEAGRSVEATSKEATAIFAARGAVHQALGEFDDVLVWRCKALEVSRLVYGNEHPEVAINLSNSASVLQELGRLDEASKLYEESLSINRRVYGNEHPEVACNLSNMARVLQGLGQLNDSLRMHEESLAMKRKVYGNEHPKVAIGLGNMASVLQDLGRLDEALKTYEESLAMKRRVYENEHPEIAIDLGNVAGVLQDLGRLDEALKMYEESLAIHRRVYGNEHPTVATALGNMAGVFQDLGRLNEALKMYEESLAIDRRVYGNEHPGVATDLSNMAIVVKELGRLDEALNLYTESLAIHRRVYGDEHPEVAIDLCNLAVLLGDKMNRPKDAKVHGKKAHEIFLRFYGSDHSYTKMTARWA